MGGKSYLKRRLTLARRRYPKIRKLVPPWLLYYFKRAGYKMDFLKYNSKSVKHLSEMANVYHCCVHKTGSQWIQSLLSDYATYQYSGLRHYHYQTRLLKGFDSRKITERNFDRPFPTHTIVSPIYISYDLFEQTPKPDKYRAFFVIRDPRDIVVSFYFSLKYSHVPLGNIPVVRKDLEGMSEENGIIYTIRHLKNIGLFDAIGSWANADKRDRNVRVVRYEDLRLNTVPLLKDLFTFCDIKMPVEVLNELVLSYSFEKLTGRRKGDEDASSHIRKGAAGDWRNRFNAQIEGVFYDVAPNLVRNLGYSM